jgi:coniferyl-aldehyde dehydrogenase
VAGGTRRSPDSVALMPLATALAAGNRAMIKPSELTPQTSASMRSVLSKFFADDQVAVVTGDASIGIEFSRLPFVM